MCNLYRYVPVAIKKIHAAGSVMLPNTRLSAVG
jgi:hypothetical protein